MKINFNDWDIYIKTQTNKWYLNIIDGSIFIAKLNDKKKEILYYEQYYDIILNNVYHTQFIDNINIKYYDDDFVINNNDWYYYITDNITKNNFLKSLDKNIPIYINTFFPEITYFYLPNKEILIQPNVTEEIKNYYEENM